MLGGIYNALSGMGVQQAKLDTITSNLTNVNTLGFKSEQAISQTFGQVLRGHQGPQTNGINIVGKTNMGSVISRVVVNQAQGQLIQTGNNLDLALDGAGFYTVQVASEQGAPRQLYSRNSSFSINRDGYLITSQGDLLLDVAGKAIPLGQAEFTVNPDGTIVTDENQFRLMITEFANPEQLKKTGEGYFSRTDELEQLATVTTQIRQGFVEKSNVDVVNEMTGMIAALRSYEATKKLIQAHNELLGKVISQVGTLR